jgi:hypothetical protein
VPSLNENSNMLNSLQDTCVTNRSPLSASIKPASKTPKEQKSVHFNSIKSGRADHSPKYNHHSKEKKEEKNGSILKSLKQSEKKTEFVHHIVSPKISEYSNLLSFESRDTKDRMI